MLLSGLVSMVLMAGGQRTPTLESLLESATQGGATAVYGEGVRTFFVAEGLYRKGNYEAAQKVLDTFWTSHPAGTQEWGAAYQNAGVVSGATGLNFGRPGGYYALRMLSECVKWRGGGGRVSKDVAEARLTVVLVGQAKGVEPRSVDEMKAGCGIDTDRVLEQKLFENDHKILKESLWLFEEYVTAATRGAMVVRPVFLSLPKLSVPTAVTVDGIRHAGLSDPAWSKIWSAVGEEALQKTDWWWLIYPSAVPEKYPDFKTMEFVTGGMGTGPDGMSPCFIIDDRWLTRKPPHLGQGPYSDFERKVYLPQWLQHEFFHHLFRIYPEFWLEKEGHDWFDLKKWPTDFVGRLEPDYYAEALNRRFVGSTPSLAYRLKYAQPDPTLWPGIKVSDLLGRYVREPKENDWHEGHLSLNSDGSITWTNEAGRSWSLRNDLARGRLLTGRDCPYFESGGVAFQVILKRTPSGKFLPEVEGFGFQGGMYRKQQG